MTGKIVGDGDKKRYYLDGELVSKRVFDKAFPPRAAVARIPKRYGQWPMRSVAMAVRPKEVKAAMALDRKKGAPPTEYEASTDGYTAYPKFTSEAHKRAFIHAHGYHDRDSYCG